MREREHRENARFLRVEIVGDDITCASRGLAWYHATAACARRANDEHSFRGGRAERLFLRRWRIPRRQAGDDDAACAALRHRLYVGAVCTGVRVDDVDSR